MIILYFKRYFTQTIIFVYKISYIVPCTSLKQPDTSADLIESVDAQQHIDKLNAPNIAIITSPDIKSSDTAANPGGGSKSLKAGAAANHQNKFFVEIWLSWNYLHVKSKYQNLFLIEKVRQHLILIRQADLDRTFEITSTMLNPPEILKLKEPLFKILLDSNENEYSASSRNDKVASNSLSIENLNYELNVRSNKISTEQITDFAHSWVYLAFFKYTKHTMERYFGMHNLKLILDYDRPMPDTSSVLFDMKNTMILMYLEIYSLYGNKNVNNHLYYDHMNSFNDNSMLTQEHIDTLNNLGYANVINMNQNALKHNIFQCQNSLNKLCVMLIDWCDIMLVENCVYLKFLTSSAKYLPSSIKPKQHQQPSSFEQVLAHSDLLGIKARSFYLKGFKSALLLHKKWVVWLNHPVSHMFSHKTMGNLVYNPGTIC